MLSVYHLCVQGCTGHVYTGRLPTSIYREAYIPRVYLSHHTQEVYTQGCTSPTIPGWYIPRVHLTPGWYIPRVHPSHPVVYSRVHPPTPSGIQQGAPLSHPGYTREVHLSHTRVIPGRCTYKEGSQPPKREGTLRKERPILPKERGGTLRKERPILP